MNKFDSAREIEAYANILKTIVIEYKENKSKSINTILKYASRIVAEHINPVYASKNAYDKFYSSTGKDIRKYDCYSLPKIEGINGQKLFTYEHMIPVSSFREELFSLYDQNKLSVDLIKELMIKQTICWVTKDEDQKLKELGYAIIRPKTAYMEAGIEIYK